MAVRTSRQREEARTDVDKASEVETFREGLPPGAFSKTPLAGVTGLGREGGERDPRGKKASRVIN